MHTFSKIDPDHDGDGDPIGDGSRYGKRLQDTHCCIGALDHRCNDESRQKSQKRILKRSEHDTEISILAKRLEDLFHQCHAIEKHTESDEDPGRVLQFFLFGEQADKCSDTHKDRTNGRRAEQLQDQRIRIQISQSEDLCGRGTSEVGTEYYGKRLSQLHDPCIYKAADHDRYGCRALKDGGNGSAEKPPLEPTAGFTAAGSCPFQNPFHTGAGHLLQG